jgi:uncharacterized protein
MRLAVIGDVHVHMERLAVVLARIREVGVDGVLQVGDLSREVTPWRKDEAAHAAARVSAERVLDAIRGLGVPVLWVPGNHDPRDLDGPGNVDGTVEMLGPWAVHGIGGSGPARFGFPYEWDEDDIRGRTLPPCDILVSHTPPARTRLDRTRRGQHVGSEAIRELAEGHSGLLVCGHIHEAPGVEMLGDCLCVNAGGLGEPYGAAQVAFVEDLRTARLEVL